jgi:hypothetical protein
MVWTPKTPQKIEIVRQNTARWKAIRAARLLELQAIDDAKSKPGKSIFEITHERNDPKGMAIVKAWKDRE